MTEYPLKCKTECKAESHGCASECQSLKTRRVIAARATPADQEMRMETPIENMARDMREGRFPERSEPQMIATPQPPQNAADHIEAQSVRDATLNDHEHDALTFAIGYTAVSHPRFSESLTNLLERLQK